MSFFFWHTLYIYIYVHAVYIMFPSVMAHREKTIHSFFHSLIYLFIHSCIHLFILNRIYFFLCILKHYIDMTCAFQ